MRQVLGAVFFGLERHAEFWLAREGSEPVRTFGEPADPDGHPPDLDPDSLALAFREGVESLAPVLEPILEPDTLRALRAIEPEVAGFDDGLWARVVVEFVAAHHRGVMHGEHLIQALVPLYLGRTAGFVRRGCADPAAIAGGLEELALEFERAKPELVRRWNPESGR
jgi:hypothetical protein